MKNDAKLSPALMLIMYRSEITRSYQGYVDAEECYFEYAPVEDGKAGALVPLSDSVSAHLGMMLSTAAKNEIGGFIPKNVLYCGFNGMRPTLVWYTKPMKRTITYSNLGIDKATFEMPWLVWQFKDNKLFIHAAIEQPTEYTELYRAPFGNIDKIGLICLGSGTRLLNKNYVTFTELIGLCEAAFFGTNFTHQSTNDVVKGNMMSLHKKLNGSDKPFPITSLIKSGLTIKSIVNEKETDTNEENTTFDAIEAEVQLQ